MDMELKESHKRIICAQCGRNLENISEGMPCPFCEYIQSEEKSIKEVENGYA